MSPTDSSLVGRMLKTCAFEVTAAAIVALAEAIGDPCPAYREGLLAPPTFPDVFGPMLPGLEGVEPGRIMQGEQELVYEQPLQAGDRITCVSRVADVTEKETRIGRVSLVVVETEAHDDEGALVFTARATAIVR